jgi:hypothetical protein
MLAKGKKGQAVMANTSDQAKVSRCLGFRGQAPDTPLLEHNSCKAVAWKHFNFDVLPG